MPPIKCLRINYYKNNGAGRESQTPYLQLGRLLPDILRLTTCLLKNFKCLRVGIAPTTSA